MRCFPVLLLTALAASFHASPATASPAQNVAREAAAAAVAACSSLGFRVMATVVDSAGRPVAAMVIDPQLAEPLARDSVHAAQIAAYFHDKSSNIPVRIMDEPSVTYALRDHPRLAPLTPGGVPFPGPGTLAAIGYMAPRDSDQLSAIGVAGAPDGEDDEECARAGVVAVLQKLP
jgi:uncharacterized protein GlcG (DUF336 family)